MAGRNLAPAWNRPGQAGVEVEITSHCSKRFRQRLNVYDKANQRAWVRSALARGPLRRQKDGTYLLKLTGTPYRVVLDREPDAWVAITVK